jgi:hypothetical protein
MGACIDSPAVAVCCVALYDAVADVEGAKLHVDGTCRRPGSRRSKSIRVQQGRTSEARPATFKLVHSLGCYVEDPRKDRRADCSAHLYLGNTRSVTKQQSACIC